MRAEASYEPEGEARGVLPDPIRPLTDKEFRLFQRLIEEEAGIHLSDAKRALLVGRLSRRLRDLGLRTFTAYYETVAERGDPEERTRMIDRICTNETHFFREPRQFDFVRDTILPRWAAEAASGRRAKRVRAWSAACSTGEEPYSLAMLLHDHCPPQNGWEIEILASDLSTRVLERAQAATYSLEKKHEIPETYLRRYMLRGTRSQEGQMRVGPAVRDLVRFARVNLNGASYPVSGPFDLLFCRNTLIYFESQTKARVVDHLLDLLAPDGYLFLGHAESMSGLSERARSVGPTVYSPLAHAAAAPSATLATPGERRRTATGRRGR
jgi:chemotaxis protein methyltransferase CheR